MTQSRDINSTLPPAEPIASTAAADAQVSDLDSSGLAIPDGAAALPGAAPAALTSTADALRARHTRRPLLILAAMWMVLVIGVALVSVFVQIGHPEAITSDLDRAPSFSPLSLGTDDLGRSELARLLAGTRVTLTIGPGAAVLALIVGALLGVIAGYLRSAAEVVIDLLMTAMLAIPPLILLLALTSVLKPSITTLMLALSVIAIPLFARVAKANTLVYANREWVMAARAAGASHARLVFREVLPSVMLPLVSYTILTAGALIIAEGSLSYLGLGVPPPQPTWGAMVAEGQPNLATAPHEVYLPALAFVLTVVSLNLLGDWVRQRLTRG